jgi:2-amino-4-hydroxy-6-hydroxymethyldihydropteridine diphosphokinase
MIPMISTTIATSVPRQDDKKALKKFIYDNFKFSKVHNSHSNKKVSLCSQLNMTNQVFLLLGTNLGSRAANLAEAIHAIDQYVGKIINVSSIYETAAWGKTDQPAFLNQAVEIVTPLCPEETLNNILSIEERLGRRRNEHWGERIIDIDILFYGTTILDSSLLTIPHPQLANRRFTLIPLNEIAPDFVHPILKKSVAELLLNCTDGLGVVKFANAPRNLPQR